MDLQSITVSVLGAGRSGRAAAVLAASKGARVTIYDASVKATFEGLPEGISGRAGVGAEVGAEIVSDLVILSPGIPTQGDFAQAFARNGKEFIGETEFAFRFFDGQVIGITGTNGKTTTTELTAEILSYAGVSAVPCGNYGTPLSEVVTSAILPEVAVLELSSFQLETMTSFRAEVAVWLNFAADHMDRYTTLDEYRDAKAHIFDRQTAEDLVVIRAGETIATGAGRKVTFSSRDSADFQLDGKKVTGPGGFKVDLEKSRLRGSHNAENVMAAAAATMPFGVSGEHIAAALESYRPPEHRCEYVATVDGVEYINDSKATNLHALESAIQAFDETLILILGGKQKNLDYCPLLPLLKRRVRKVVTFGEIRDELKDLLGATVETVAVETLPEAVSVAADGSQKGDIVLFSPGTSSFDQFSGYEDRGRAFRSAVNSLNASVPS